MDAVQDGVFIRLDEGDEIVIRRFGIPLLRAVGTVAGVLLPANAGIEEMGPTRFILAATAGEAVNLPLADSRCERNRHRLP